MDTRTRQDQTQGRMLELEEIGPARVNTGPDLIIHRISTEKRLDRHFRC